MKKFLLFFLITTILFSCRNKKDLTPISRPETEYHSLKKGQFFIYNIREINYSFNTSDTNYLLKTAYPETWADLSGELSFKEFNSVRPAGEEEFLLRTIGSAKKSMDGKYIHQENNTMSVKLFYPVFENKTWNGNMLNGGPPQTYQVINVGKIWGKYPETVTVVLKNDSSLLSRNYEFEIYAKNKGLIYKEIKSVNYSSSAEDFGKGIIVDGVVYKQSLLEYGME